MPGELLIHYGNPGAGKTLFAMKEIVLPAVREHRPFFTNITGISVSALSYLAGVHQAFIKYYPVENISDVIRYFDDEQVSHDGVFILDEMKDFIDDDKAVSWLESRINVMRKHSVDFVFIAQQCKKEYIHPNLVGLANACNVYRTRKRERDLDHVTKYYVPGGVPKIVDNEVANAVGKEVLKKPVEMYNTFETSQSAFYTGAENDTFHGLPWYKERKWKLRFILISCGIVVAVAVIFILASLFGIASDPNKVIKSEQHNKVGEHVLPQDKKGEISSVSSSDTDITETLCYNWKVCDGLTCKTDIGTFISGASDDGRLCVGRKCYYMCQDDNGISGRGGLLRDGEQVPKGDGKALFSFGQVKGH